MKMVEKAEIQAGFHTQKELLNVEDTPGKSWQIILNIEVNGQILFFVRCLKQYYVSYYVIR